MTNQNKIILGSVAVIAVGVIIYKFSTKDKAKTVSTDPFALRPMQYTGTYTELRPPFKKTTKNYTISELEGMYFTIGSNPNINYIMAPNEIYYKIVKGKKEVVQIGSIPMGSSIIKFEYNSSIKDI